MTIQKDEVSQIQKRICSWTMISSLIVAGSLILFHKHAMAKGLLLGTLFSVLNFVLLGRSISAALGRSGRKAVCIRLASLLTRYSLLAVPLALGVKSASFDFIAIGVGVFGVQITALIDYLIVRPIFNGE